ncbi:beta-Ig-H3/fasciclin [Nonlabens dokdonensis]|uniref:Beta-Ig-H3/fasciclin n=1 Tax=Nonlabens dokdonensis TaxID=328515 RepID=A0A1Z8AJY8_9FLAO|nr:fasciclin domain-containing protein [Nonlabens dokdonensis]OUS10655.1 beta-Ig-H3/fasciclin [Nonlabens dokdonensis]
MKNSKLFSLALVAAFLFIGQTAFAQSGMMKKEKTVMVGGAEMYPSKNIIENAVNSKDHTTLVAAVKAGELVEVLSGEGPFTVFAPTNAAFDKLPEGTVANLLKPENKKTLQTVLTYHVIAGKFNAKDVIALIKKNDGIAAVKTVAGTEIRLSLENGKVTITDANGGTSTVTIADVNQSNGVIHVVDSVLLPKM